MDHVKAPALFVGEIDENIDMSVPPTSGEEYIKRVVIEAQKCADVVVADVKKIQVKTPTVNVKPLTECVPAPPDLSPSLDWQQCQVADFSNIRLYISQLKDEIQPEKRAWKASQFSLPSTDDRDEWISFCLATKDDQLVNIPTLNIIICFNQPTIEQALEYLIEYIGEKGRLINGIGQWIYALLVVLELPLNPDTCSCLRSLARTCSVIRANNNLEVHEIGALNLFICLVARYFRQLDLADP